MSTLDRHILSRFLANFLLLFALLYLFAAGVDFILNLDNFVEVARELVGDDAAAAALVTKLVAVSADFQGPRVFQFYAYLHGMIAIGAMGFTLAQMYRHKELVAMMAAGMSLHRVAMPFLVGVFMLSVLQLFNQEWILPRVAPLLLRSHGDIGQGSVQDFRIDLLEDAQGALLQSPRFRPGDTPPVLDSPTILQRDERGLVFRHITAERAEWDAAAEVWRLHHATARTPQTDAAPSADRAPQPVESFRTSLSPEALTIRHYAHAATMLSLRRIRSMLASDQIVEPQQVDTLRRQQYSRFASVVVNLLVMVIALPCFLLREPANLLRQSITCATLAIPGLLGASLGMMIDLPGIPPAGEVFLPAIVLFLIALARVTMIRT